MTAAHSCSVTGCLLPYRARGFCVKHYAAALRTGALSLVRPRNHANLCPRCKFRERKRGQPHCNPCHAEDEKARQRARPAHYSALRKARYDPVKNRARSLAKYGLTPAAYDALLLKQAGLCAICRGPGPFHIDHDHTCCKRKFHSCGRCVRGLLCAQCNIGLGHFSDDPQRLRAAAGYVTAWAESMLVKKPGGPSE